MDRLFTAVIAIGIAASVVVAQSHASLEAHAIVLTQPIGFESGTTTLDAPSQRALREVVALMIGHPTVTIEVGSHTDTRGSSEYNLRISQERADAVRAFLVAAGVPASRITARGYGEAPPTRFEDPARHPSRARIDLLRTDVH